MASGSMGFILLGPDGARGSVDETSGSAQKTANEAEALQKSINADAAILTMLMQSTQEAKERLREEQDSVQRARAMLNAFCAAERSKVCWSRILGLGCERDSILTTT